MRQSPNKSNSTEKKDYKLNKKDESLKQNPKKETKQALQVSFNNSQTN